MGAIWTQLVTYWIPLVAGAAGVMAGIGLARLFETRAGGRNAVRELLRGAFALLDKDYPGARTIFAKVARGDSDLYEAFFILARVYREQGDYVRSMKINEGLTRRQSLPLEVRTRALYETAVDLRLLGDAKRAYQAMDEAADKRPRWPAPVLQLYRWYDHDGDVEQAEAKKTLYQRLAGRSSVLD